MSTYSKQTITVACRDDETVDVEATVIGPFAVHPRILRDRLDPKYFTITHIPSGRYLANWLPSQKTAVQLVNAVLAVAPEWATITSLDPTETYTTAARKIAPLVSEYR